MTDLTGRKPKDSYKDLLQVSNSNSGIDSTLRAVEDGEGTASPLQLSSTAVNIQSGLQLGGVAVTPTATELNHVDGVTSAIQTQLDTKQPLDATLTAMAGVATAADQLMYATGSDTFTTTSLTSAGRDLLDDANAAAQRTTLGLGQMAVLNSIRTDIQYFASSGTWTKPAWARFVEVWCVGAGTGGNSGTKRGAGANRGGGAGGGAGCVNYAMFLATQLGDTETVTIGAGSTGAAAVTANTTNGNNASAGGATFFGGTANADCKLRAQPGTTATAAASTTIGTGTAAAPGGARMLQTSGGGSGGIGLTTAASSSNATAIGPTGGGGGGGIDSSNNPGDGSGASDISGYMVNANLAGGSTGGTSGSPTGSNGIAASPFETSVKWFGRGGGGGYGLGGIGGNGSAPGGGGGGGGAGVNDSTDSGAGGNGADGGCLVIAYG